MSRKALPPLPPECEELREQLEHWRKTREKRSRVPDAVWESAARLAQEHGTNRIARALRLNHSTLKKRLNGASEPGAAKKQSAQAFAEVNVCQSASPAGYVVHVEKRSGTQMRIELKGGAVHDILAIMRAFCNQET